MKTTLPTFMTARFASSISRGRKSAKYKPSEYADYVAEHVETWTYLKFPYLKKRGWKGFKEGIDSSLYCASPLARLNVADRMATPRAQQAYEEMFATLGGHPCKALMANHWARLVEMVQNAEMLERYCADPEITSDTVPGRAQADHGDRGRHRRSHARHFDPSLHLRRERHLYERESDCGNDQQQCAHSNGDQEGGAGTHQAREGTGPGNTQYDRNGLPCL